MPQLFPPAANTIGRAILPCVVLGVATAAWAVHAALFSSYATDVSVPVEQPVPFSHQHHVAGLGIDCRYCHTGVETSPMAGIPPTETCMTCHSQVWRDAPVLAPVRESWATGRPLRWTRVHDLPDYVYFDHSIHVSKGVACVTCHGRVDQMPLMSKAHTLTMRWCLDCHRAPENRVGPREKVFSMPVGDDSPLVDGFTRSAAADFAQSEKAPVFERGILALHEGRVRTTRLEDCSICHR